MRLSCVKDDPGYHPDAVSCCSVYLDGVLQNGFDGTEMVLAADEERGHVLVYLLDEKGHARWDHERDEPYMTARYGEVELKFKNGFTREYFE